MPATTFRLATQADNAALLRLLRDNPMPGSISLTFEREPDYFIAAGLDGSLSQTVVSIDEETGECQAMGARSVHPVFLTCAWICGVDGACPWRASSPGHSQSSTNCTKTGVWHSTWRALSAITCQPAGC